ncbi:MAG TPA: glycosyltransferase, partial [Solirubrobacteraceae bacterium]|nr:glycosyltransferase [Solirubrobacteraceae bacterium]
ETQRRLDALAAAIAALPAPPPPVDEPRLLEAIRVAADDEPRRRDALWRLRTTAEYAAAWDEDEPLVSVVIPTYRNYELLRERSLPSVLAQTYERLEVVVVGDAAPDAARHAVESFGDPRVRFYNLPMNGPYPEDPEQRWHVSGVPPYNEGTRLATGRWIAPQDDDDEWHPDHVERLLTFARARRVELAYGRLRVHRDDGAVTTVGKFPPELGEFAMQASLYHAGLAPIFECELSDGLWGAASDWAWCRRVLRAGVRAAMLDEEVAHYHTARFFELDAVRFGRELAPEGWEEARAREGRRDGAAEADTLARAWPDFVAATEGQGPLPGQAEALALGHVLARAAGGRRVLSVLDWGGAIGGRSRVARALLGDVELDYHVRDLPAFCARGREVAPDVVFHEGDDALARRYDLVAVSGLEHEDDWAELLRRLAEAAEGWLFVTRLPVVRRAPGFVDRPRDPREPGVCVRRVLNRDEVLAAAAAAAGFELEREYVVEAPQAVAGAPEDPVEVALAFRRQTSSV